MPFRGTHIKVWWASTCVSPKYSAQFDSILVITSQANKLKVSLSASSCSSNDETASQIGLEGFLRLRFVNDLAYGVWTVPCCPSNLQQGVDPVLAGKNAWSQITFVVRLNLLTYLPSQVLSLQMRINEKFHFTHVLVEQQKPDLQEQTLICEAILTIYL